MKLQLENKNNNNSNNKIFSFKMEKFIEPLKQNSNKKRQRNSALNII